MNIAEIIGGLIVGACFGVVMQRSRFCMVAAVTSAVVVRDYRYLQAFLAAWAISILGVSLLETFGIVAVAESGYRTGALNWLGAIAGGLVFGFGATLAGGCAARTVINTAEGNLGSLLALLTMMLFAGITTFGALEPVRMAIVPVTSIQLSSGDSGLGQWLGAPTWLAGVIVAAACIYLVLRIGAMRENRGLLFAGAALGLLVVAAWLVNGWLIVDEFSTVKPSALAITGPLAKLNLYLATGSGNMMRFGVVFITAMFVGALVSAALSGRFALGRVDASRIPLQLAGGALMGIGATFAGGCNIGQGLSGVSTLSLTSLFATAAMFGGTVLGIKWWERRP